MRANTRLDQLEKEARKFDRKHPEVWEMFVEFTLERIKRGFRNYGGRAIFERIRWETARPEYEKGEEFKLNDHHIAFYSRWFHNTYPEHDGFFRLRVQRSESRPPASGPPLGPKDFEDARA